MPDTMRIVRVNYHNAVRHEVTTPNGAVVMRAEYVWMATSWCRENSLAYTICENKERPNMETRS